MVNVVKLKLNHLPGKKLSSVDIVMVTVKERMTSELKPKHCVFGACCNFILLVFLTAGGKSAF